MYIVNTGKEGEYLNWLNNLGRITVRVAELQRSTVFTFILGATITTAALTPYLRLLHIRQRKLGVPVLPGKSELI